MSLHEDVAKYEQGNLQQGSPKKGTEKDALDALVNVLQQTLDNLKK